MEMLAIYKGHSECEEGVAKSTGNAWRKVAAIFETVEKFPKTIAVTGLNAMCETILKCIPGRMYRVNFDVESRPWTDPKTGNERWFTDCKAWGIALEVPAAVPGVQPQPKTVPATPPANWKPDTDNATDDLPF